MRAPVSSLFAVVLLMAPRGGHAQVRLWGAEACRSTVTNAVGDVTIVCEGISQKALAALNRRLKSLEGGVGEQISRANRWAEMYKDLRTRLSRAATKDSLLKAASKALQSGDLQTAETLLSQAVERLSATAAATAKAEFELGSLLMLQFREHEALPHLEVGYRLVPESTDFGNAYAAALVAVGQERDARAVYEAVLQKHSGSRDAEGQRKLAVTEVLLAESEFAANEVVHAETHFSSALSRLRELHDRFAEDAKFAIRSALISIYLHSDREAMAAELIRGELRGLPKRVTDLTRVRQAVLTAQLCQAIVRTNAQEALALASKAMDTLKTLEPSMPELAEYVRMAEMIAAEAQMSNADAAGAERVLIDATARADRLAPKTPADREFVVRAWELYGDVAGAQNRFDDAVEHYRRSIAHLEKFLVAEDGYAERYGDLLASLGTAQIRADDGEGAEKTLTHALGVFDLMKTQNKVARGHGRLQTLIALARLYALAGIFGQARKAYNEAIEEIRATLGQESEYLTRAMVEMGNFEIKFAQNTMDGCRLLLEALLRASIDPDDRQRATTAIHTSCPPQ